VRLPPDAYVDEENRFGTIVPSGWKIFDPQKVKVDRSVATGWRLAATLVFEAGLSPAPTIAINVKDGPLRVPWDERGGAEIERWLRSTWGNSQVSLELKTELTEVDPFEAFHTSALATIPGRRSMTLDVYIVSAMYHSYAIVGSFDDDCREEAAKAVSAVAQGFHVLSYTDYPVRF
jgi:hypothetical protein